MTKGKNYNSIVFLTTLSVYLGLVLVGATPQVMAQAALTRNFDIQIEAEVKDDLDNKPDDEEIKNLTGSLNSYFEEVEDFIQDLQKLHSIGKFDLGYDEFEINQLGFVPCKVDGDSIQRIETIKKIGNRWLEPAIADAGNSFEGWDFLSDCLKDEKVETGVSTGSGLKLSYDDSGLKIEIAAFKSSPQRAAHLAGNFNRAFRLYKVDKDEPIVEKIHENTSFKSDNNQVFIVTRLPRGSIDSLLAKNAK